MNWAKSRERRGCTVGNSMTLAQDLMQGQSAEILIVDDTLANLELLVGVLHHCGYRVKAAINGEMALRVAKIKPPDLILMDICLPGIDGYDVCRCLKNDAKFHHIPVIFVSSLASVDEKIKAFKCGGVDYIVKPFSLQEVQARIASHLRLSRMHRKTEENKKQLELVVQDHMNRVSVLETSTIFALAKLAESCDANLGEHFERVKKFSWLLSEKLFEEGIFNEIVTARFGESIFHASSLHDIGKIAIPDAILLKQGKLTETEFEVVKTHTVLGAQTLEAVFCFYPSELLEMALAIARSHHEKWDGSGYPDGLTGESIPLCARIMGLVDVYDAICSSRCYKEAMSHETACNYIRENSGKHFDPQLVEVFLQVQDEFLAIYNDVKTYDRG